MLERTHQFLTGKTRADIEIAAERFFPALGYRVRMAAPARAIVFERGRRLASLYRSSLRACAAEVAIDAVEGAGTPTAVQVRHRVTTFGRLIVGEDATLLDTESRAFERFLERGDVDTAALLDAALQSGKRAVAWKVAAILFAGAVLFFVAARIFR